MHWVLATPQNKGVVMSVALCCPGGFHQAVIGNYAVPILEDRSVWGTNDASRTAYMDSQDAARLTLAALRLVG
jgi:hypothetical protein